MLCWSLDELIREVKVQPKIVNSVDAKGAALMHYAAKDGSTHILEFLIANGGGKSAITLLFCTVCT